MQKTRTRGHIAMMRRSPGSHTHRRIEEVSPTSADGEHDIRNPHSQKGAEACTQGCIRDGASCPEVQSWSSCPITFDRRDHPTSIRHGEFATLVLNPIIDGFHLTRVLMDSGSSLSLLYQDTVRKWVSIPRGTNPAKPPLKASSQV